MSQDQYYVITVNLFADKITNESNTCLICLQSFFRYLFISFKKQLFLYTDFLTHLGPTRIYVMNIDFHFPLKEFSDRFSQLYSLQLFVFIKVSLFDTMFLPTLIVDLTINYTYFILSSFCSKMKVFLTSPGVHFIKVNCHNLAF